MGQFTNAGVDLCLDSGVPATIYQGLSSTTPTAAGANVTEPVGNGYARKATNLAAAASQQRASSNAQNHAAAGGDWGLMTHTVYFTALTGGTFIYFDDLDANRNMVDGAEMDFAIGAVVIGGS